ncbi:FT-interacting protein 3-like [Miscanthus floridulus]|uniref:FT-interacting protein 3-like n=1 Tax=Miscanthus floridulus TaxID=154761 RepID=UPI0034592625
MDTPTKKRNVWVLELYLRNFWVLLDESTHYSSDLQPSAKKLRKSSIGILELGILSARNLVPMKAKEGRLTDPYCVAKYGSKWVRTRTVLNTLAPQWNEQYTWEVFDPCTIVTVAVFDNGYVLGGGEGSKDQRIGKVRVRLSTLEIDRVYTHFYPLMTLTPGGLKKTGELHLALRFTCTAWANMLGMYTKPLLPKMHYHYRRHIFSRRPSPLPSAARLPSEAQNHPPRDLYTVREGFSCRHGCSSPAHTDDFRGLPQLLAHRTERGADRARGILTKNSDARVQSAPTAPRDRLHPQSIFLGFLSASLLAPHPACRIERRRLPLPTQRPASPPPPPAARHRPPAVGRPQPPEQSLLLLFPSPGA